MRQGGCFADGHDARTEIFVFIEGYSNTHRKRTALGYLIPDRLEAQLNSLNQPTNGPEIRCISMLRTFPTHFMRD